MGQRKLCTGLSEAPDVVREPDFIELLKPDRRTSKYAEAQTGKPLLGQRAHHQQIILLPQLIHKALTCEGMIGLIQHHKPRGIFDQARDILTGK